MSEFKTDTLGALPTICLAEKLNQAHLPLFDGTSHDDSGLNNNFTSAHTEAGEWSCAEITALPVDCPPAPAPAPPIPQQDNGPTAPAPADAKPVLTEGSPPAPPTGPSAPGPGTDSHSEPDPRRAPPAAKIAGSLLTGLGVAFTGAMFGGAAAAVLKAERAGLVDCAFGCNASDHDLHALRIKRDAFLGVGISVGAAMVITGLVLLVRKGRAKAIAWAPLATSQGAGFTLSGPF